MESKNQSRMLFFVLMAGGIIIFALGITSALNYDTHEINHYIGQYGGLFSLIGFLFFVACQWCYQLHCRVEKIERILKEQETSIKND